MQLHLDSDSQATLEQIVGYLNFSSGATDSQFLQGLDQVYIWLDVASEPSDEPLWRISSRLVISSERVGTVRALYAGSHF